MLQSEFEILTGIYVDDEMMDVINERYMDSGMDKREFCMAYKSNQNGMANSIQQETNRRIILNEEEHRNELKEMENEVMRLQDKLDEELEWTPYGKNSAMNAVDYTKLLHDCGAMGKEAAAEKVEEEFGFRKDCVDVLDVIPVYKKNRHGAIREFGSERRPPVYSSSDWNYIRFDVVTRGQTFSWEMVNGELEPYEV